ncbi:MAG: helix-turn-helix domain-containing protein [Clostridiales bacterium]|jgi:DNA-binding PucR family transcriptional regulator|nr:helix-turn-helix domain-containing protein [Eubacteriales bacterium]MDH7566725.1 helix-turn-helix domain-containing protein [Clostridiales bacterium]
MELSACCGTIPLLEFCHPSLLTLMEYDRNNNANYTRTLYVFILNKGNQNESAKILHIHRTTMIYRMEKIEAIMDIKLDNIHLMYNLYLSFMILKYADKGDFMLSPDI